MANQGAKKRRDENKQHMAKLLRLIVACNVIYVVVRMFIFHSTISWKHWVGLLITSAAYALPYQQLAKMAKPSYSDDGELLDGGFDMNSEDRGRFVTEKLPMLLYQKKSFQCFLKCYLHDVIYITSFVQLMSILSGKFWYTYLVIPAFGAYKLSGLLKGVLSGSEGPEEDEKARKKREKMERKASRHKFLKTRNR